MPEQDSFTPEDVVIVAEAAAVEAGRYPDAPSTTLVIRNVLDALGLAENPDELPVETADNVKEILETYARDVREHMAEVMARTLGNTAIIEDANNFQPEVASDEESRVLDASNKFASDQGDKTE